MKKSTLLTAALVASIASSHAATIETENFNFVPVGDQTLTFNQVTLGAGESISSITFSWSLTKTGGSIGIDNESQSPASGQASQTITLNLSSSDVTISNGISLVGQNIQAVTTSPVLNVGADDLDNPNDYDIGGPDNATHSFSSITETGSDNIDSANFGGFAGGGTFEIVVDGTQFTDASAFGGASQSSSPSTAEGFVTVTIETIPEPSSSILLGLAGFGLLLRRRA